MPDKDKQPKQADVHSGNERPHNSTKPVTTTEGHPSAVRGTSITPGEAGSRDSDTAVGDGLTERLDAYDEVDGGVEGRLGGETANWDEDIAGGTAMDEPDDETPRRGDPDW